MDAEVAAFATRVEGKAPVQLLGVEELPPAHRELFEYYQQRLASFDTERADLLRRLRSAERGEGEGESADGLALGNHTQELHRLRWDNKKKEQQIAELQKALSDAHVYLYDEREQALALKAGNEQLRIQESEDRRRISHLLALTQPVSQEVTYMKERRPDTITRAFLPQHTTQKKGQENNPSHGNKTHTTKRTTTSKKKSITVKISAPVQADRAGDIEIFAGRGLGGAEDTDKHTTRSRCVKRGNGAIVRTVYMPNESVEILKQMIASLKSQLEEQKTLSGQRHQALLEDRLIREAEMEDRSGRYSRQISLLERDIASITSLHEVTTKDYLELRHRSQVDQTRLREQMTNLEVRLRSTQQSSEEVRACAREEAATVKAESGEYVERFRTQALGKEEELAMFKHHLEKTQRLYEGRISELLKRLTEAKSKIKFIDRRRTMDLEGFVNDFRLLRTQVKEVGSMLSAGGALEAAKAIIAADQIKFIKGELSRIAQKLGLA